MNLACPFVPTPSATPPAFSLSLLSHGFLASRQHFLHIERTAVTNFWVGRDDGISSTYALVCSSTSVLREAEKRLVGV